MYKSKNYQVRDIEDIYKEIDELSSSYPQSRKVFLADGDALSLDTSYLLALLKYLKRSFVKLRRVSLYASAQNILNKSSEDLELLFANGLNLIYYGVESGSDIVLKKITKGVNQSEIIESLNKASDAGMKISASVILGIGGAKYSNEHIRESAKIINETRVTYFSTLQLGLEEESKEKFYKNFSDFTLLDDYEILHEQKRFIELLNPRHKIIFRSNHASNALHLKNIFASEELEENSVVRNFRITAKDGKNYVTQIAKNYALSEFEKYRVVQDRLFLSDFDKLLGEIGGEIQ